MHDTRTHILEVGRRLTAHRGYASVGLSELLRVADVPKGSFYHYFASKEDYGCALLEHYAQQYRLELGQTLNNEALPARDRILSYFTEWQARQVAPCADRKCLVVKLAAEISDLSPDMRAILQAAVQAIIARLSQILQIARRDGSVGGIADTHATATTLYQIWLGASLMAHLSQDSAPFEAAMAQTRAMIAQC